MCGIDLSTLVSLSIEKLRLVTCTVKYFTFTYSKDVDLFCVF